MNYVLHLLIQLAIFTLAAYALNVVVGYTGLLSLSHATFFGVGAYAVALLATTGTISAFPAQLFVGVLAAMLFSTMIAGPALRLKEDYFVLATLGVQLVFTSVVQNWSTLTNGPLGIRAIPRPTLVTAAGGTVAMFLIVAALVVFVSMVALFRILNSPFGLALKAVREDELSAQALGKDVKTLKIQALVLSAVFASVAGSLYASYVTFVDPSSCNLDMSIFMVAMVVLGGSGNLKGPVIGAAAMIALPELLRFLSVPSSIAANLRQIIYGAALVVVMRYRPQGIAGEYRFE